MAPAYRAAALDAAIFSHRPIKKIVARPFLVA
jgi:hypothetical protein